MEVSLCLGPGGQRGSAAVRSGQGNEAELAESTSQASPSPSVLSFSPPPDQALSTTPAALSVLTQLLGLSG